MTVTINSTIPVEERREYIERTLILVTSETPVIDRQNIECSTHDEMIEILSSLSYKHEIKGDKDRYIVLPPVLCQ